MPRFADLVDRERLAQALGTQEDRLDEYAGHTYVRLSITYQTGMADEFAGCEV
jgi:hypothetical protein